MKLHSHELNAFCINALSQAELPAEDAQAAADVLVTTDMWGIFTHGTKNLRGYIRRIRSGGIRKDARPKIVGEGPAWAIVDADSAIGPVGSCFAMREAIRRARSAGLAYVGVRNSCHFGAAGYYAAMAAREGMIGLAMANDTPTMTVPGARGAVLGNNPIAFAVPTGEAHPILLDIALSSVAGGKVFAAATRGDVIPNNWLVDSEGLPTTDPRLFPHSGALTPMAGHKGYGLALLVETLSAILTGASIASQVLSWSFADASLPTGHGAAFIAVDINAIMPAVTFKQRVRQTIQEIRAAPNAKGADRIYLPGEMEWNRYERALAEGLELPDDVVAELRTLANELSLDWKWSKPH
ncbi:MAG: Ldh family oxidoreductase [Verrucomicrobia subdivision 3 bacterium]|nr:Ldh family oxidoreductase [Limisphaerales bacterium]